MIIGKMGCIVNSSRPNSSRYGMVRFIATHAKKLGYIQEKIEVKIKNTPQSYSGPSIILPLQ